MKKTYLRRSLAALTTVVACLAIMGSPASAAVHQAALTGGTIVLSKTGVTETITLGTTTGSCSTTTITVDLGTETTGASVTVTAFGGSAVQTFSNGSYLSVLSRSNSGNTAGTLTNTTTGHTISAFRVAIVATIYNTTSCTPTGTPVCTIAVLASLTGSSTSTTATNTFSLTGSSVGTVAAFPTCAAGPSQILGTSSSVTSPITGTLTT